jgi:carboxymethylenebutenolidase
MSGQEVSFTANHAPVSAYWAPAADPDAPGVLVLHAWWGLNAFFKRFCARLAEEGFSALAPSLFDGKTASTIPEAEALVQEFEQGKMDQVQATALAALAELRRRVPKGKLGMIGFSFGAAWACVLAVNRPDEVEKVTLVYGLYDPGLDKVKADFLGHFAENDQYAEPMEYVRAGEVHIKEAGRKVIFHVYPGTAHWFFEDDRPEYETKAASLAWDRTLAFFKELA